MIIFWTYIWRQCTVDLPPIIVVEIKKASDEAYDLKIKESNRRGLQNGAAIEVEKQGTEKGTYQHPELYGQPAEKGLNYEAPRELPNRQ